MHLICSISFLWRYFMKVSLMSNLQPPGNMYITFQVILFYLFFTWWSAIRIHLSGLHIEKPASSHEDRLQQQSGGCFTSRRRCCGICGGACGLPRTAHIVFTVTDIWPISNICQDKGSILGGPDPLWYVSARGIYCSTPQGKLVRPLPLTFTEPHSALLQQRRRASWKTYF